MAKSAEYWKDRFSVLEDASNKYGQDCFRQIEPAFDKAQREIEKEINSWYARFAKNNQITITEAKRLLNSRELRELKWDVDEYIKYGHENNMNQMWMKELENASAKFHISRLEALKIRTQQAVEVAFGNEFDAVDGMVRKVYSEGYYRSIFEMQKGFNIGWDVGQIDDRKLEKLISKPWTTDDKTFKDRIWTSKNKMVSELHQQLTRTCVLGKAPDEAINEMTKYVQKDIKNAKYVAGRLVMTEQAYFHSVAQKDAFEELDVEEFEIVATLDSHTSDICQDMDGQHFPMKEYEPGVTAPPFHVWCRSVTVPYFEDNFTGERAARDVDGNTYYVPDNMTYKDWKKSMVDGQTEDLTILNNADMVKDKPKVNIDDCTSTEEVVKLFKSHDDWFWEMESDGKIIRAVDGINLDGVDLESAKAVYRPFEAVFEKFPQLKGKLNGVNSASLSHEVQAECFFGLGHGGVAVNKKFYSNIDKLKKSIISNESTGFHPKGVLTPDSIVTHELGHAIDDYLSYVMHMGGSASKGKVKTVSAMLRPKVMRACGLTNYDINVEVSGYATKNAQEWFGECFAEYMCSENPRKVATEFGRQLEELLKEVE